MTAGVYTIVNVDSGMRYVGCSKYIEQRIERHFHLLEDGQHPNFRLQDAFNLSPDRFAAIILETTDPERTFEREQVWIDRMVHHLYNLDLRIPDQNTTQDAGVQHEQETDPSS